MARANKDHPREAGQTIILFILMVVVLMGAAALSIDVGIMFVERAKIQGTVDGAAIAGADKLPDSPSAAVASAQVYAEANGVDLSGSEYTFQTTTPYGSNPNQIEVQVSKNGSFIFGRVLGFDLFNVNARAVGEAVNITTAGACTPGVDPGCVACTPGVDAGCVPCDPGETACDPGGGATGPSVGGPVSHAPVPMSECGSDPAVVDGRIMPGEGYQNFSSLIGSDGTQFGDAFFSCDAGFLYFALRLNSVDTGGAVANENVYGPGGDKKTGAPGYNDIYQTGLNKHDFGALIKSDRARFQTSCGGTVYHDFVQDYLRQTGSTFASDPAGDGEVIVAGPSNSASSLEWNLEHPAETGWGDDPGEILIDPAKKSTAQSPPFNPLYPDYDAEYDGWVWEMIYEFRVPISDYQCGGEVLFGLPDFTGSTGPVGGLHSSPPKVVGGEFVGFDGSSTRTILLVE